MLKEILLPDLGEGISSADVSEVLVSPGDSVSVDDIILVLESEKASMEIPSENEGIIKKVFISAGDQVKTGEILIMMEVVPVSKVEKKKTEEKVEPKKQKDQKTTSTPKPLSCFRSRSSVRGYVEKSSSSENCLGLKWRCARLKAESKG